MAERGGAGALPEVPTLQIEQPIIAGLRQALVYLAAGALCLLIIITVVDVVGRYLLNAPLPGAFESVRALMALVTFSALPLVCVRNEHLRAGILDHLISQRLNRLREPVVQLISVAVLCGITWRLGSEAMTKRRTGEVLSSIDLPLWMPISFMTVMGALAVVVTMALAALTLRRAFDRAVHDR
jgi:TRAP-type C4-dicarboxylate transport system permease small subunit